MMHINYFCTDQTSRRARGMGRSRRRHAPFASKRER